jgi:hypothetical protein
LFGSVNWSRSTLLTVHPVEHDRDFGAVAGDVDVVPFAGWFRGVGAHGSKVVDRPGGVIARLRGIIDGDFDAVETDVLPRSRIKRAGAYKDAAVAAFADFEIEREKSLPAPSRESSCTRALVRVDAFLFDRRAAGLWCSSSAGM